MARLAGFQPAGILVEILNDDGSMARLPQLLEVAQKFDLKIISIEDLVAYRMEHDSLIVKKNDFEIETRFGSFRLRAYQQTTNEAIHMALTKGHWSHNRQQPVIQATCRTHLVKGKPDSGDHSSILRPPHSTDVLVTYYE